MLPAIIGIPLAAKHIVVQATGSHPTITPAPSRVIVHPKATMKPM